MTEGALQVRVFADDNVCGKKHHPAQRPRSLEARPGYTVNLGTALVLIVHPKKCQVLNVVGKKRKKTLPTNYIYTGMN